MRLVRKQVVAAILFLLSGGVAMADLATLALPPVETEEVKASKALEPSETIYLANFTGDKTPYQLSDVGDRFTATLLPPLTAKDLQIYRRAKVKKMDLLDILVGLRQEEESRNLAHAKGLLMEPLQTAKGEEAEVVKKETDKEKAVAKQVTGNAPMVWNEKILSLSKDKEAWNSAGELAKVYDSHQEEKEEGGDQFTTRGIHTGSTRGELLFSYGNPTAIWRTQSGEKHIFLYAVPPALTVEEAKQEEKVFWTPGESRAVEDTYRNSAYLAPSFQSQMKGEFYLGFTLKHDKVETMQAFSASDIVRADFPSMTGVLAVPNEMKESDFSYQGYNLRAKLRPYEANDWEMTGKLQEHSVVQYRNALVVHDKDFTISHVISVNTDAITRRGIAMGDSKYLLLFIYGKPTYLFKEVMESKLLNVEQGKAEYYVYKNPNMQHEYLVFAVGTEDGYIKQITLTNRVSEKVG